ncbi:MAG: hypothetical protein HN440_05590, partial [Flavobacteriaceae bacterium]|nr:hypothetical protein [Flavobacteriaceae bacterium]
SKEISKKKKLSKKTKKKIKSHSFSDEQVEILKSLSQKMSKIIGSDQKKKEMGDNKSENFNQRKNLSSKNNGRNFSGGQRQGPPSNRQGTPRSEAGNPVFEKLMQYIREQGVSRENIRDVMSSVRQISQEYKSAVDRSSFKPSDDTLKSLSDAGLSNESISIIVEIIKIL